VREDAAALAVQISRQGDLSGTANVEWTTFAGSAEPQSDYVSYFRRAVRFTTGEEMKTIFIPIVSDDTVEAAENFRIALSRPGNGMVLAEPFTATVTIVDDDF
jgi:vacuolar-type H+-ATPase subunit B/Vma2